MVFSLFLKEERNEIKKQNFKGKVDHGADFWMGLDTFCKLSAVVEFK